MQNIIGAAIIAQLTVHHPANQFLEHESMLSNTEESNATVLEYHLHEDGAC
jgi:hypothetical protein